MTTRGKLKSLLLSWDFGLALGLALLVGLYLLTYELSYEIAKEVYGISVSVLSIVFAVFFAALAVLITAGDNNFVRFLKKEGLYGTIIWTFKATLLLLFAALLASIVLFVATLPYVSLAAPPAYPKGLFTAFALVGFWALFATINSTMHAIKYAEFRAEYLDIIEDD